MNQSQTYDSGSPDPRLFLWPRTADFTEVRGIVESLNLGYVVRPFHYDASTSEGVKRVLVLADGFDNGTVVDYIYPKSPALLEESVRWALGLQESSRGARLWQDTMKRIFGADLVWESVSMNEGWQDVG